MAEDKALEPVTLDPSRPYIAVDWGDDGGIRLRIGGNIAYDHLITAGFMVSRQASVMLDDLAMRQMMARNGEGGLVPFASIPEALKQRGS